jgi:hypothetical protein
VSNMEVSVRFRGETSNGGFAFAFGHIGSDHFSYKVPSFCER